MHPTFDRVVDGIRIVNAGSVGAPYYAEPGSYWALLDADVHLPRRCTTSRPRQRQIAASGYLKALEE